MRERRNTKPRKPHTARRIDAQIGAQLRRKRLQRRIPSAFLAKYLGVGRDELAAYECGEKEMLSSQIYALAGLFGVSPDYFFAGLDRAKPSAAGGKGTSSANGTVVTVAQSGEANPPDAPIVLGRMHELTNEIIDEIAGPAYPPSRRKRGDYTH